MHKCRSWLDRIDVLMEMLGKRPFWRPGYLSTIFMLKNIVLGVQQAFSRLDINVYIDPVLGRTVGELANTIGEKPLMYEIQSFVSWLDELVYLLNA